MKHIIHEDLLTDSVDVAVVGCGGTGSMILSGLARLHLSMIALGHPGGLNVTAYDPDNVSDANVGRQLFWPGDVGTNKAIALINRLNVGFRLDWKAEPENFKRSYGVDIVIGCVDSRASRREIKEQIKGKEDCYYLDCGNGADYGQVFIGDGKQLPFPWQTCPALFAKGKEDNTPSCSLAEALGSQELFINQAVATMALQLLWSLFRRGGLDIRGYYINLKTGRTLPVPIEKKSEKSK
jgi:PRTRC genetic system ThiF family protein